MKTLLKLTIANIKMYFRDKSALIWTLFFPFMIIAIFGVLDFAKYSTSKIGLVYNEDSKHYAEPIKEALVQIGDHYKVEEGDLESEKQALTEDDRLLVLNLDHNNETGKVDVTAYLNKGSEQGAQATFLIIQKILSDFEIQIHQIEPIFSISSEIINVHELRTIDFMVPGVVAMALMQGGIFGVVGTIVAYREKGILKRLFATPLPKGTFLLSQILSRLILSILQVIILLITSYVIFKINIVGSLFLVALVSILGSLTFLSLGFAVSGIAKTSESARAIVMPIQMIMMFTSGVYFPRDVLPSWLYKITGYTPLTYLADSLRDVMIKGYSFENAEIRTALIGIIAWLLIFIFITIRVFKWEK